MERRQVGSGFPWETEIGYSRAVRVGNRIFVSGTVAAGPDGPVAVGDVGEQSRFALGKIRTAIESLGGKMADVVRTRIQVEPGVDWKPIARVHREFFASVRPACTLTFAPLMGDDYLVEIEAEVIVGSAAPPGD